MITDNSIEVSVYRASILSTISVGYIRHLADGKPKSRP